MGQRHVIVWDLDGTLGDFTELEKHPKAAHPIPLQLRPGVREALRQLTAAGFIHTVLTVATKQYADLVLHGTGLAEQFALIEGRSERPKGEKPGTCSHFVAKAPWMKPTDKLYVAAKVTLPGEGEVTVRWKDFNPKKFAHHED